jgi:hypothetical protein
LDLAPPPVAAGICPWAFRLWAGMCLTSRVWLLFE